jgi:IS30 family transposase
LQNAGCAIARPLKLRKISTSENANGLSRQYFSKGSDFSKLNVLRDIHQIA